MKAGTLALVAGGVVGAFLLWRTSTQVRAAFYVSQPVLLKGSGAPGIVTSINQADLTGEPIYGVASGGSTWFLKGNQIQPIGA